MAKRLADFEKRKGRIAQAPLARFFFSWGASASSRKSGWGLKDSGNSSSTFRTSLGSYVYVFLHSSHWP